MLCEDNQELMDEWQPKTEEGKLIKEFCIKYAEMVVLSHKLKLQVPIF